ncbi:Tol-Pal system protein TolB [Pseudomonadota bacterium]
MKKLLLLFTLLIFVTTKNANSFILFNIKSDDIKKIDILFTDIYYHEEFTRQSITTEEERYASVKKQKMMQKKINKNKKVIDTIISTIKQDLSITDLFLITEAKNESPIKYYAEAPNFEKYKKIDALTKGEFNFNKNGEIELKLILWDILDERQCLGKIYVFKPENYKKVAHIIADEIYKNLTGEKRGFFNSKITYVAESGDVRKRDRKIVVIDFDGSNRIEITYQNKTLVTPLFSRVNKNDLFFVGYEDEEPLKTFKLDVTTGFIKQISSIGDMTFSPNYNPIEENSIILSATQNGITDIHTFNLKTGINKNLTNGRSIDTTPSYSPDGKQIVFCSDREGSQKLYIMNSDGTDVKKITKERGLYSKPAWSPDGRLIAFIKILNGNFSIGVITPKGKNERILVEAYSLEGVRWSPNGRYLIYSKQVNPYGRKSIPHLYITDILTGYEHRIPTPLQEGAIDPDWIAN